MLSALMVLWRFVSSGDDPVVAELLLERSAFCDCDDGGGGGVGGVLKVPAGGGKGGGGVAVPVFDDFPVNGGNAGRRNSSISQ